MDRFVNLHRHTSFSGWDGLDLTVRGADFAAKIEQPALAITDHGNVFGVIEHFRWTSDRGLKPIVGMEAYVVDSLDSESPRRHLTVLVKNRRGYENLMRLVTLGYQQIYYKPRVTFDDLEAHATGLIVLSGCPSGHVAKAIEEGDLGAAEGHFVRLLDIFGKDFYAEIQHHERAQLVAPYVFGFAEKHGVRCVATNDAHYVEREDRAAHDLLLKIKSRDKGEENPTYGAGFHMVTRQEMREYMLGAHSAFLTERQVDDMLDETVEVAEKVDFTFEKPERMLPPLWGDDAADRLEAQVRGALQDAARVRRLDEDKLGRRGQYLARLEEELRVVRKLGYAEYFLLVSDVTSWARGQGILIGPRGSVCGSLLAYALGITMVDPLVHGTMFERFLHDQKKSPPDIDLDIDSRRRDEVHQYVLTKYSEYAFPIVTFGRWGAGNVSNDLSAVLDLSERDRRDLREAMDELKRARIFVASEEDLEPYPVFLRLEKIQPGISRIVTRLYSMVRYVGRHPGGLCFVPGNHYRWFGVAKSKDEFMTTGNFQDVEYCGLLKVDFLGLAAVASVAGAIERIKIRLGDEIDLREVPLDDSEVLRRFAMANTDGVFQFETRGAREILREIEPDSFAEVAAATALNRPGVSDNLGAYVRGKAEYRR